MSTTSAIFGAVLQALTPLGVPLYASVAEQGAELPFATLELTSQQGELVHGAASDYRQVRVQLDLFARTYREVDHLAEAVRRAVEGRPYTVGELSFHGVALGEMDTFAEEERIYRRMLDFQFYFTTDTRF